MEDNFHIHFTYINTLFGTGGHSDCDRNGLLEQQLHVFILSNINNGFDTHYCTSCVGSKTTKKKMGDDHKSNLC